MEGTIQPGTGSSATIDPVIFQLTQTAIVMSSWLKFLGVIAIVSGAVLALTFVGIIFAWLPIWLGVLLFQAGDKARSAQYTGNLNAVAEMMDKLRAYFVIYAVAIIVSVAFSIMFVFFMATFIPEVASKQPVFLDSY
mgnify:CR=1 FL=1